LLNGMVILQGHFSRGCLRVELESRNLGILEIGNPGFWNSGVHRLQNSIKKRLYIRILNHLPG
jgi:hypothetical protein